LMALLVIETLVCFFKSNFKRIFCANFFLFEDFFRKVGEKHFSVLAYSEISRIAASENLDEHQFCFGDEIRELLSRRLLHLKPQNVPA